MNRALVTPPEFLAQLNNEKPGYTEILFHETTDKSKGDLNNNRRFKGLRRGPINLMSKKGTITKKLIRTIDPYDLFPAIDPFFVDLYFSPDKEENVQRTLRFPVDDSPLAETLHRENFRELHPTLHRQSAKDRGHLLHDLVLTF